jgi:hypothetical protein
MFVFSCSNEDFKSHRVILVLTARKTIIGNQESICSCTVTVEKLVPFFIAGSMARIHRKIYIIHVSIPPFGKLFFSLISFSQCKVFFALELSKLTLSQSSLFISRAQSLVILDQEIQNILFKLICFGLFLSMHVVLHLYPR